MKARDLILGVVAAVIFWMVVIAPMAISQVPEEVQRISIDLSVFKDKDERAQIARLIEQLQRRDAEIMLKIRNCCP